MDPLLIWFTGLSGAGKTTLALHLQRELEGLGRRVFVLDGDDFRKGLSSDLDFSRQARRENIRRAAHTANLFLQAGFFVIAAFISPYEEDRKLARQITKQSRFIFIEVYLDCPLEICQKRDPKALYAKAQAGEIQALSGWDAPFETPQTSELVLKSAVLSVESCIKQILDYINNKRLH